MSNLLINSILDKKRNKNKKIKKVFWRIFEKGVIDKVKKHRADAG